MKELNVLQMEEIEGGALAGYIACRVGFAAVGFATGMWWLGFAGAILCPAGDLN